MAICKTLGALALAAGAIVTSVQAQKLPIQDGAKVLFVGNSYTQHGGGLDNRVEAVAAADNPPVTINADQAITFAVDLDVMWNSGPGPEMIRNGNYDIVVIQGWEDAADPAKLDSWLDYASRFAELAKSVGSQPVFFCPWAMTSHNWYNAFTRYVPAFDTAGARAGAPVVHVGRLWWDLRTGYPLSRGVRPKVGGVFLDSLFMFSDAIHPNDSGQYINALAFYAFFTNKSPESLGETVSGFSFGAEFQDTIQARVWKSVRYDAQKWYAVGVEGGWRPAVAARVPQPVQIGLQHAARAYTLSGAVLLRGWISPVPGVYVTSADRQSGQQLKVLNR